MSSASARNFFGLGSATVTDTAAAFTATARADERLVREGCTSLIAGPTSYALIPKRMTSPARRVFLAYNTAFGALAAHAAVRGEPGLVVIGAMSLGWGALATTGVFLPWLEIYGRIVSRGPADGGRVALTFDDGPHPVTTRRVLEALAPTRHRATFFVLGETARAHREGADQGVSRDEGKELRF